MILACLAALLPPSAQAQSAPEQTLPELKHQVGLIDLAYIFKNSHKFVAQTESLQQEIEKTDREAKSIVDRIRQLQTQLSSESLPANGPEFAKIEEQLAKAKSELETFKRISQQSFLRKEAEIYKTVYLDVEDAVRRYATYYKYTLVLRFDRADVGSSQDPREVMNGMNRQIVHYRSQDDITEPILKFLNGEWEKQGGTKPVSLTRPSGEIQFYAGPITR